MISLKRKESGFTIVELLIVIVVIGILAALVVTTFSGIQRKARNTERETDIKAIHGQLEAFHADQGRYPTLAEVNQTGTGNENWRAENMKGLDADALQPPNSTQTVLCGDTTNDNCYAYVISGDTYTLSAKKEGEDGRFEKAGLN